MHAHDSRRVSRALDVRTPFVLAFALLACSSAGTNERENGGPIVSDSGALSITWKCVSGEAPVRGRNRFELTIESTESGELLDGLALSMVPFMPAMGHGSSTVPTVTALGSGTYDADDVVLAMPGLWELRTTISAGESDYAAPRVEID
jgi:hypothetical protein